MTDLVTGGSGFIGRHLVRLLLERGRSVRVLDLAPVPAEPGGQGAEVGADVAAEVESVVGSITDAAAVRRAMTGARRVFHVAGNPNLWARRKEDFAAVNHQGTRIVLEEAARAGVARFVHTSTGAILFRRRHRAGSGAPATGDAADLDEMPGPYCRSKLLAEREALAAAERGQPVVVVNPTVPLGPGDHRLTPPSRMIADFVNGATPAFVEFELNLIDVRDVAAGMVAAAEVGRVGERYLLGAPANRRLSELLAMIERITGVQMPRRRVPYPVALVAAAASELIADRVTGTSPQATLTGVRLTRRPVATDLVQPLAVLGVEPRPLAETVGDALRWLAAAGHIRRPLPDLSHWSEPRHDC